MKQKGKEWTDYSGKAIPTYAISPVLKVEEKHANRLAAKALKAERALIEFDEAVKVAHFEVLKAKIDNAKFRRHKEPTGQISINSFDHTVEVKITKPEIMYFDSTFTEMVKETFDKYFNSLETETELASFLRNIVQDLLFTSSGRLDATNVLQLRKYRDDINNSAKMRKQGALFVEAVDLFDKAISKKPGNPGVYVSVAENPGDKKRRVILKNTDV